MNDDWNEVADFEAYKKRRDRARNVARATVYFAWLAIGIVVAAIVLGSKFFNNYKGLPMAVPTIAPEMP